MALLDKRREMFISGSIKPLPGEFSVSATKKVQFAPGNLQAVISGGPTNTYNYTASEWKLAENQWDYIGNTAGGNSFAIGSTVDLFGWVGEKAPQSTSTYGLCTSTSNSDYRGEYLRSDWGNLFGNTWRILTIDEWDYLLFTRTTSYNNARFAKAFLFGITHGIILFPDSYTHPDGVAAPTGRNATGYTSWSENQYNATDWAKMEAAGAVFLPAAGSRNGTHVTSQNSDCRYWSSTPIENVLYGADMSYHMFCVNGNVAVNYAYRYYGYSVRLVKDVN